MSGDYRPIATAPRDGTIVDVLAEDCGPYRMKWNGAGVNPLVSLKAGIWEAVDGAFTWSEDRGAGPTHWRPAVGPVPVSVVP